MKTIYIIVSLFVLLFSSNIIASDEKVEALIKISEDGNNGILFVHDSLSEIDIPYFKLVEVLDFENQKYRIIENLFNEALNSKITSNNQIIYISYSRDTFSSIGLYDFRSSIDTILFADDSIVKTLTAKLSIDVLFDDSLIVFHDTSYIASIFKINSNNLELINKINQCLFPKLIGNNKIIFARNDYYKQNSKIIIYDILKNSERKLFTSDQFIDGRNINFSYLDSSIVYIKRLSNGEENIWKYNIPNKTESQLTNFKLPLRVAEFQIVNDTLLYVSYAKSKMDINWVNKIIPLK